MALIWSNFNLYVNGSSYWANDDSGGYFVTSECLDVQVLAQKNEKPDKSLSDFMKCLWHITIQHSTSYNSFN